MAQINLTDEEIQKFIECLDAGVEIPEELLPKLSPGFFEKLRAAGEFDYKELDKYRIPTIEYAGKQSESVILAQAAITGGSAPLQVVRSFGESTNQISPALSSSTDLTAVNKRPKSMVKQTEPLYPEVVIEKGFAFCNVTHYNEYILTVWS